MSKVPVERFTRVGDLELHYFDYEGDPPTLVCLPGLTANANSFDGLIEAGLSEKSGVLAVDLRGRGQSGKPRTGYTMAEHAADVVRLLDEMGLEVAVPVGHSFGGLLALYLGARYADRFPRLVIMDVAGPSIRSDRVLQLIQPSLERLGKTFDSWDEYLGMVRGAPYLDGFWTEALERYFEADVETLPDGAVRPRSSPEIIQQAISKGAEEDWQAIVDSIRQPVLLINAPEPYGGPGSEPLLTREEAEATVEMFADGRLVEVPGNHLTMLFGAGAAAVVQAVLSFIAGPQVS